MQTTLTLAASLESLTALRRFLEEVSAGIGRDDQAVYDLKLAVDEIATNAITYGGAGERDSGTLSLHAEKTPEALTVILEDSGERFDPRTAPLHPPPGGWGVRLALEGVDRFEYQRDRERNRNIFVLSRPRPLIVDLSGEGHSLASRLSELGYEASVVPSDIATPPDPTSYDVVVFCASTDHPLSGDMVKRFNGRSRDLVPVLVSVADVTGAEVYLTLGADDVLETSLPTALLRARLQLWLDMNRVRKRSNAEVQRLREAEQLASDLKNVILPLGLALSAEKNCERLLERILIEAQNICHADGGTLYLRTPDDYLSFSIMRNETLNLVLGGAAGDKVTIPPLPMFDAQTGEPNLQNIAVYVAHNGHTINIPDSYSAEGFDFSGARQFDQTYNYRSQSFLTIPLKDSTGYAIGVLQLINARERETGVIIPFDGYLQEVAECLASQTSVALNNFLLMDRQRALLQIENDLKIGRQLQENFLPPSLPQPEGWEVAACLHPAREVSGDFYDVFWLSDRHLGLVIADVCNKGVGAALFMAMFRTLFRSVSQQTLARLLSKHPGRTTCTASERQLTSLLVEFNALSTVLYANNYVAERHSESAMFATTFFAVLDVSSGTVTYINAGHDAPLVIGPSGIKHRLELTGPVVGMAPNTSYTTETVVLEPGDSLFCYTDGVTEAHIRGGEMFGEPRMLALIREKVTSAAALVDRVDADVFAHYAGAEPFDDITMLVVRRTPTVT